MGVGDGGCRVAKGASGGLRQRKAEGQAGGQGRGKSATRAVGRDSLRAGVRDAQELGTVFVCENIRTLVTRQVSPLGQDCTAETAREFRRRAG